MRSSETSRGAVRLVGAPRLTRRALAASLAFLAWLPHAGAQRLAFRPLGAAEGLPHPRVSALACDGSGALWLGTWEGLCRFDGRRCATFGVREGLASPLVVALACDPAGRPWFATHGGGVARFVDDPAGGELTRPSEVDERRPLFASSSPAPSVGANVLGSLVFDGAGRLWCATEAGFFRGELDERGAPRFELALEHGEREPGLCLVDAAGEAVLLADGLLARARGEALRRFPRPMEPERGALVAAARVGADRWLVAHERALFTCELSAEPERAPRWQREELALSPGARVTSLAVGPEGERWVGTTRGLLRSAHDGWREIGTAEGLPDEHVLALCFDHAGGLWVGMQRAGAARLGDESVVRFEASGERAPLDLARVVRTPDGELYASSNGRGLFHLAAGELQLVPGSDAPPFAEAHVRVACDASGAWWFGDELGLFRAPGPAPELERAERVWPPAGAPPRAVVGELRELAPGRVWFSDDGAAMHAAERGADGGWEIRSIQLPPEQVRSPPRLARTLRCGDEWCGTFDELARYRGGVFELLEGAPGLPRPSSRPRALLEDGRGRLWVGLRFEGLRLCEDPSAERPSFRAFTRDDGLASDTVWSLAEDPRGALYAGTGRGLARFDEEAAAWRPLGTAFGDLVVNHVLCDGDGYVWAASSGGLLRVDPRREPPAPAPPPVRVHALVLDGRALALPPRGARSVRGVVAPPGSGNVVLEYGGVQLDGTLRYQHRLVGAEPEWSAPSERAAVHYAGLAPGSYVFEARAVDIAGRAAGAPAVVELCVLAPIWRRGWFLALASAALLALAYALHRGRLRRALALERVRAQIAGDLHDDLGAGLAQIAILAEVGRRGAEPRLAASLAELAGLARSMRESMAEIVWAIDPRRDKLLDLVRRMRQVAAGLLEVEGVVVELEAPSDERLAAVGLSPEERRQLLLLFKEACVNVARHARASRAEVRLELDARGLRLRVRDDGRGFDPAQPRSGQGLAGMQRRAGALGAELALRSAPGRGTEVELLLPLRRRRVARARR